MGMLMVWSSGIRLPQKSAVAAQAMNPFSDPGIETRRSMQIATPLFSIITLFENRAKRYFRL